VHDSPWISKQHILDTYATQSEVEANRMLQCPCMLKTCECLHLTSVGVAKYGETNAKKSTHGRLRVASRHLCVGSIRFRVVHIDQILHVLPRRLEIARQKVFQASRSSDEE